MGKDRLAAFSDGVIAIIITIMVLELHVPHGSDWSTLTAIAPSFLTYVLSFISLLQWAIIHRHGKQSVLAEALGRDLKGKITPFLYFAGIALAFVNPWLSIALYVLVTIIWLVPDQRIERIIGRE